METEGIMNADLAAEFWTAVEDCLVRFHRLPSSTAKEKASDLWKRLRQTPQPEAFRDMIYHEEPWYVACGLAGKPDCIPGPDDAPAYEAILKQHGLFPTGSNTTMSARS